MELGRAIRTGLVAAVVATAATPAVAGSGEDASRKAKKVIQRAWKLVHDARTLRVTVDSATIISTGSFENEMHTVHEVAVERPNKVAAIRQRGRTGGSFASDGEDLIIHMPILNSYTVREAPESLGELNQVGLSFTGPGAGMGVKLLLAAMADSEPTSLLERTDEVAYIGVEKVDGRKAHHLRIVLRRSGGSKEKKRTFPVHAWVAKGKRPLLLKLAPDMEKMMQAMGSKVPKATTDMKTELVIRFKDWAVDKELPPERFAFTPPDGAEQVGSLVEAAQSKSDGEGNKSGSEKSELEGKPAPDFELPLLGGEQVKLSEHKGKHVVILDFWATWCGPCRKAMPILAKVARAYRDKGVRLYAVNEQEKPQAIRGFLKEEDLDPTVALDRSGKVAKKYKVEGIPTTVIIDRKGIVRDVHVGYDKNLREQLTRTLDSLVGKAGASAKEGGGKE